MNTDIPGGPLLACGQQRAWVWFEDNTIQKIEKTTMKLRNTQSVHIVDYRRVANRTWDAMRVGDDAMLSQAADLSPHYKEKT